MRFSYILRDLIKKMNLENYTLPLDLFVINDYIKKIEEKNKKKTDIQVISLDTSDKILKILKSKYSVYPNWLIQKYLNEYDIQTVIEDTLMENTIYTEYIINLKGRKISSSSINGLEICETDNSLWDALITIVFMDIEIDTESDFLHDYYFRIMYDKVKEIYDKTKLRIN